MSVQLKGFHELERALKTLPDRVQRKLMRAAMNAAGTPVLKSARSKARKRTGLMKRAMAKKVVTNKKRGSVSVVIGAKKSVQGTVNGRVYKPSRVLHLVEKGHIDKHGEHVPPQPALGPAMAEKEGEALNVLKDKLGAGIEKEAKKAA